VSSYVDLEAAKDRRTNDWSNLVKARAWAAWDRRCGLGRIDLADEMMDRFRAWLVVTEIKLFNYDVEPRTPGDGDELSVKHLPTWNPNGW
jgi:hypothetical protein